MSIRSLTIFVSLSILLLTNVTYAGDLKKAGTELQKRGVTTYEIVTTDDASASTDSTPTAREARPVKLALYRGAAKFAVVTVDEIIPGKDHIIRVEPVTGEGLTVESYLSKGEFTFRSGEESVTSRFDIAEKKWKRTGSEALFLRAKELSELAALLIVELQDRGVLQSSTSSQAAPPGSQNSSGAAGATLAAQGDGSGTDDLTQDPGPGDIDGGGFGTCTGTRHNCSGYDILASRACRAAREQCALKCWNDWCIGCCRYDDCNKVCGAGDFWCAASIDGYACARTDR